jgi:squalene-hopene/tetraprenyl-beta-curcumene cyclase
MMSEPVLADDLDAVEIALKAGVDHLISRQDAGGWWKGVMRTNVTMDAEDLLLRQFLGILTEDDLTSAARWIRSQQREDGTWATFFGGPGDLDTTVEAYVALRLAGDEPDDPHMRRARDFVVAEGGIASSRVFTRLWLALFGEWSWDELPEMPPELIFLPKWAPLNIYDWGCWARQTVVPITVVATLRPVRPLPFTLDELHTVRTAKAKTAGLLGFAFSVLDRALKLYEKSPVKPGRDLALRQAAEWILARQETDGGWGGIQPPWVYSILALHLLGYPLDHPAVEKAIDGLEGFLIREHTPEGPIRWLEACQSPVWDTCLAVTALLDAGLPAEDPAVRRAARWILDEEIFSIGDWSKRRPDLPPGGMWAFEFANDGYPDVDDTAEVVISLDRVPDSLVPGVSAAIDRGIRWGVGMQSRNGGWGAFDADNTSIFPTKIPFSDFGAVVDPPSADVTAHMIEMLSRQGLRDSESFRRGLDFLRTEQEADGAWFGRWGNNYVYGTAASLVALVAADTGKDAAAIARGVAWLEQHQNEDGGWGEDIRSYFDQAWRGRGVSTPAQTAWALQGLIAVDPTSMAVLRGVEWLVAHQRPDGGWDEDYYTGTGFPGAFYLSYEMYRYVFPISALGRYVSAAKARA